ncbi:putative sulfonate/nitrate transport system substrate-binding protein [Denitrovibrio acetiphilus DSM 12809]|uniref:Putative sulfonate/nitrate transport system substrate-binding protein n=1 Tax=Denitrovibrio acetiphilus (strain DSM 12809 / NBRC 114555 / N2460) TaxID=522772 RepID=D4H2F2_DENA2|nr:ABC transporter substrate-binding protein [Denitrovibrio acetiphilus]ADD68943.1 putative sulfonate/nitrate transport system substrate-binding protein [Denitrovibrio acetiphilus DSM 12809]
MKNLFMVFFILVIFASAHAEKRDKLVFTGPFTAVSYPLIYMADQNSMGDFAHKTEFRYWQNPDQLRAMIAGEQADFAAAPSYVGAMFYNKGISVKLMNISVWGILHVMSSDPAVKTFQDMKGKKVAVPFRGEMPDLIFRHLAEKNGIEPEKDYDLIYVAHPMDIAQILLSGRADTAMSAEPAVSMTIAKSKELAAKGKGNPLVKVIDLQQEWGRVYDTSPRIAQAGTLALASVIEDRQLLSVFEAEFEKAAEWLKNNPEKAADIIVNYLPNMSREAIVIGIRNSDMNPVPAYDALEEIKLFFSILHESDPSKIGGQMPDGDLYYHDR